MKSEKGPPEGAPEVEEEEEYDPYKHRKVEVPTTNIDTFIHSIKGSLGSGVLAMPQAFKHSGTVTGVIGTLTLSSILVYGIILLVRSQNSVCKIKKRPYVSYPHAMKHAFKLGPKCFRKIAPLAPVIVDFFLIFYQLGICCSYLAFISQSLKEILEENWFTYKMDYRWYLLIILVPILAINCIRTLKRLTPVSFVADVLSIVGLLIILYFIMFTGPLKLDETTYVGNILHYPLFFGTVMFALEAVGVILALEENMQTPQDFPKVFCTAMIFVVFLYAFIGFMGYAKYADEVKGSITLSVPPGSVMSTFLKSLVAFCIFCSYPLQCYVSLDILWHTYLKEHIKDKDRELLANYGMRLIVILTTFIIVMVLSHFELIIAFVGAFSLSALGLIFPFSMDLCIRWPEHNFGPYNYQLVRNISGIILGFLLLLIGTYVAIKESIVVKD